MATEGAHLPCGIVCDWDTSRLDFTHDLHLLENDSPRK